MIYIIKTADRISPKRAVPPAVYVYLYTVSHLIQILKLHLLQFPSALSLLSAGKINSKQYNRGDICRDKCCSDRCKYLQPPIESVITTLNTASSEYRKVSSGRSSPGHQLSRLERKICRRMPPTQTASMTIRDI